MQRIVQMQASGKVNDLTLTFLLRLDNQWVSVEQLRDWRILQIIPHSGGGWVALIEQTAASVGPSPSE